MTQQHKLLFLAPDLPAASVLCCFAALARRATGARIPLPVMDAELSSLAIEPPVDVESPAAACAVVHVYQPQSSLLAAGADRKLRRGNSALVDKTSTTISNGSLGRNLHAPALDRRSLSATAPCNKPKRPQSLHLWDDMISLPALFETLLMKQRLPREDSAFAESNMAISVNRRVLRRQHSVFTDGTHDDSEMGKCKNSNSADGRPTLTASAVSTNCIDPNSAAKSDSSDNVKNFAHGHVETARDYTDSGSGHTETAKDHANNASGCVEDHRTLGESSVISEIKDVLSKSILKTLSNIEDPVVDHMVEEQIDGGRPELEFDIDELLLCLEVPIGESTARDAAAAAALEASEAELARAEALAAPAAAPDVRQSSGRRLSDTGSELANDEFRFQRAQPPQSLKKQKQPVTTAAAASNAVPAAGTVERRCAPVVSCNKPADSHKRLLKWRRSYAMDGRTQSALADWGDYRPAVLVSARQPPLSQSPPSQLLEQPRTSLQPSSSQMPHVVLFYPRSLADGAARLVEHFNTSGHPACLWKQMPAAANKPERQPSRRSRFAARLFGGSFGTRRSQQQKELLKCALIRCAIEGHLPVLLLPPRSSTPTTMPKVSADSNSNNNRNHGSQSEADKFHRQLRSALMDIRPLCLSAGLIIVFASPSDFAQAAWWAAAAGDAAPAMTVTTVGKTDAAIGPETCNTVLAAAQKCASNAALQRLL